VSIQDQGIGIPSHALEQIFAPYYRVEAESSRYITGTGLGLSIVRQIIEMHSGKIWAESTHGQGSTFYFTLPLISS
jgi:signal transduction histidine kinase